MNKYSPFENLAYLLVIILTAIVLVQIMPKDTGITSMAVVDTQKIMLGQTFTQTTSIAIGTRDVTSIKVSGSSVEGISRIYFQTENQSFFTIVENFGNATFSDACVETCSLMPSNGNIIVLLRENATLTLDAITYTTQQLMGVVQQIAQVQNINLSNSTTLNLSTYFTETARHHLTFTAMIPDEVRSVLFDDGLFLSERDSGVFNASVTASNGVMNVSTAFMIFVGSEKNITNEINTSVANETLPPFEANKTSVTNDDAVLEREFLAHEKVQVIVVLKSTSQSGFGLAIGDQKSTLEKKRSEVKIVKSAVIDGLLQNTIVPVFGVSDTPKNVSAVTIKREYSVVNAFVAEITREGLSELLNNSNVATVVYDAVLNISLQDSVPLIHANDAHMLVLNQTNETIMGFGQSICVLDTGIDASHLAFVDKIVGGMNVMDGSSNVIDDNNHGTHVSGIIAAVAPFSKIVPVKVCDSAGGCLVSNILAGIDYCINNSVGLNISVLSGSFGDGGNYNETNCPTWFDSALSTAENVGMANVFAAGNNAYLNGVNYPSCSPYAISVGASTKQDTIASFSNRGSKLDILAPGVDINSTIVGGYLTLSGTSMATPFVAGTIALIKQINNNISTTTARNILQQTGIVVEQWKRIDTLVAIQTFLNGTNISQETTDFIHIWNQSPDIQLEFNETINKTLLEQCGKFWNNHAEINTTQCPELNKTAKITFFNIPFIDNISILRDRLPCPSDICTNLSINNSTASVIVHAFSTYSLNGTQSLTTNKLSLTDVLTIITPQNISCAGRDYPLPHYEDVPIPDQKCLDKNTLAEEQCLESLDSDLCLTENVTTCTPLGYNTVFVNDTFNVGDETAKIYEHYVYCAHKRIIKNPLLTNKSLTQSNLNMTIVTKQQPATTKVFFDNNGVWDILDYNNPKLLTASETMTLLFFATKEPSQHVKYDINAFGITEDPDLNPTGCGLINQSTTLTQNILAAGGSCFDFNESNILFDCAGFNVTSNPQGLLAFNITNLTAGSAGLNLQNITVKNCNILNFSIGINISNAENITIWGNNITNVSAGIRVNNSINNFFENNTINATLNNAILIQDDKATNHTLRTNVGHANVGVVGIRFIRSSNNLIINNTGTSNNNFGMDFITSSNNNITNNTAISSTNRGMSLQTGANNNTVQGNSISSTTSFGLILVLRPANNVFINNFMQSTSGQAIRMQGTENNTFINNTAISNSNIGLAIQTGIGINNHNQFINNSFESNSEDAASLSLNSNNNTFTNNRFMSNTSFGLSFVGISHNNTFLNNTFQGSISVRITTANKDHNFTNNTVIGDTGFEINTSKNIIITNTAFQNTNWSIRAARGSNFSLVDNERMTNYTFANTPSVTITKTGIASVNFFNIVQANGTNLSMDVNLTTNKVHVNTSRSSGLNVTANITFVNVNATQISVAHDDNTFEPCPASVCSPLLLTTVGTVFNVSHFTTFKVDSLIANSCQRISSNANMSSNIIAVGTSCFDFDTPNILFDCAGFNVTANPQGVMAFNITNTGMFSLSNITIKNCNILNFSTGINVSSAVNISLFNNNISNSTEGTRLTSTTNNLLTNNSFNASTRVGLFLNNAMNNTITDNTLSSIASIAVFATTNSNNNNLTNNLLSGDVGFEINSSTNITITNTTFKNTNWSIKANNSNITLIDNNRMTNYSLRNVLSLSRQTGIAEIKYLQPLITANGTNLSIDINLTTANRTHVNTSRSQGLNVSANITLFNVGLTNPVVLADFDDAGLFTACPVAPTSLNPVCLTLSYVDNRFIFNTSHFTTFALNENISATAAGNVMLTFVKTDAPDPVLNTEVLNYTITTNVSNGTAFNVSVFDEYPQGTTFFSSSPAPTEGNNRWNFTNMTNGTVATINISLTLSRSLSGVLTNKANITFNNASGARLTINATQDTTVNPIINTPGATGGTAGASAPVKQKPKKESEEIIESMDIFPEFLKISLKQGETIIEKITLANTGNSTLTVEISTFFGGMIIVPIKNIELLAGETREAEIIISAPDSKPPDIYSGALVITAGKKIEYRVPVVIDVLEKNALFDVQLLLSKKLLVAEQGQTINGDVLLKNLGDIKPIDVTLRYSLTDMNGNELASEEDTFAVENDKQVQGALIIPPIIPPGMYLFYAKVSYGKNQTATSSRIVQVIESKKSIEEPIAIYRKERGKNTSEPHTEIILPALTLLIFIILYLTLNKMENKNKQLIQKVLMYGLLTMTLMTTLSLNTMYEATTAQRYIIIFIIFLFFIIDLLLSLLVQYNGNHEKKRFLFERIFHKNKPKINHKKKNLKTKAIAQTLLPQKTELPEKKQLQTVQAPENNSKKL